MKFFKYLVTNDNTEMLFKTEREMSETLGIARPFLSLYLNGHLQDTHMHKKHVDFFRTHSIRKLSVEEQRKYPNAKALALGQRQEDDRKAKLVNRERDTRQLARERVADELRQASIEQRNTLAEAVVALKEQLLNMKDIHMLLTQLKSQVKH